MTTKQIRSHWRQSMRIEQVKALRSTAERLKMKPGELLVLIVNVGIRLCGKKCARDETMLQHIENAFKAMDDSKAKGQRRGSHKTIWNSPNDGGEMVPCSSVKSTSSHKNEACK